MRTMTPFVFAMPRAAAALSLSVVLTMVPPRAATLCGFTSASRKPPDGFLPSGVDMVKFHVYSDGALNGGGGPNGADIFGAIETPFSAFSGVFVVQGKYFGTMCAGGDDLPPSPVVGTRAPRVDTLYFGHGTAACELGSNSPTLELLCDDSNLWSAPDFGQYVLLAASGLLGWLLLLCIWRAIINTVNVNIYFAFLVLWLAPVPFIRPLLKFKQLAGPYFQYWRLFNGVRRTYSIVGLQGIIFWFCVVHHFTFAMAVCPLCQGFYAGCTGDGGTCKGTEQVASNAAALATAGGTALSLVGLYKTRVLRYFNAPVLELIRRFKAAPVAGTPYTFGGKSYSDVVKDVLGGKVSKNEALEYFSEESAKIADAAAAGAELKLQGLAMQAKFLHSASEGPSSSTSTQPIMGVMTFVWAKCTEVELGRGADHVAITGNDKERIAKSTKIHLPDSLLEFLAVVALFASILETTGLASHIIVFDFLQRVVYQPMRLRSDPWMLCHELLLQYLDKVDQSVDRKFNLQNVLDEGVDAMRAEATQSAHTRFGKKFSDIFRVTGGPRDQGPPRPDPKPSGKSSERAPQPCQCWNKGVECTRLYPDGTCRFRHKCSQWVKDKDGVVGFCFGNHKCADCDRPAAERSSVGPAASRNPGKSV